MCNAEIKRTKSKHKVVPLLQLPWYHWVFLQGFRWPRWGFSESRKPPLLYKNPRCGPAAPMGFHGMLEKPFCIRGTGLTTNMSRFKFEYPTNYSIGPKNSAGCGKWRNFLTGHGIYTPQFGPSFNKKLSSLL